MAGLKMFLVDDVPLNITLLSKFLDLIGHASQAFYSGPEVVGKCQVLPDDEMPDMIFMDIRMPGMDGFEATRQIRAMGGAFATVPIIALSANSEEEYNTNFQECGFTDKLQKPYSREELAALIGKYFS